MYELIISNYLKKLTKEEVKMFGLKNNIILNDKELDFVYHTLKNNYQILLSDNYEIVFKEALKYLSKENYQKILELYQKYRVKYQNLI